jgi:hypothetical protein
MWIQHVQKALNEMNLHLHHVLTDLERPERPGDLGCHSSR